MLCPECKGKTSVTDNALDKDTNEMYRTRKCKTCGFIFHTIEFDVIENQSFKDVWSKAHR